MYRKVGALFCTNAVLAGVASSCVCAKDETKNLEGEVQREGFIPKDIPLIPEINQESLVEEDKDENEKRVIYAVKILVTVGLVTAFILFLGQKYLKYKALKRVDDSWKDLDNGVSYEFSLMNKAVEVDIIFKEIDSGNYIPNENEPDKGKPGKCKLGEYIEKSKIKDVSIEEKEKRKARYLLNFKNSEPDIFKAVIICKLGDLYKGIMKEKRLRNIFWCLKSADEIRKIAKEDKELEEKLVELKNWGNILNKVETKEQKSKKLSLDPKEKEDPFLAKLNKLEGADVFLELMGINKLSF